MKLVGQASLGREQGQAVERSAGDDPLRSLPAVSSYLLGSSETTLDQLFYFSLLFLEYLDNCRSSNQQDQNHFLLINARLRIVTSGINILLQHYIKLFTRLLSFRFPRDWHNSLLSNFKLALMRELNGGM